MPSFKNNCVKCGENTNSIILHISRAISGGIIILSKCAVCDDKRSKFIKKHQAKGPLNNPVTKKLLSRIPRLRDILF